MTTRLGPGVGVSRFWRPQGAAVFSPLSLPAPIVWLDAGDPAQQYVEGTPPGTTLAGDLVGVGTWRDKTANARHVSQAVGSQRPLRDETFTPSVLTCDGGDRLFSAAFTAIPQPFTFCVVSDNLVNNSCFLDNGTAGTRILAQRGASSTAVSMFAGTSLAATGVPDLSVRRAWLFEYNTTSSKIWVFDSVTDLFVQVGSTGNAGANQLADLRIFGNTAAFLTAASASEIFAFAAVATTQQRADIGVYAKAKWTLT